MSEWGVHLDRDYCNPEFWYFLPRRLPHVSPLCRSWCWSYRDPHRSADRLSRRTSYSTGCHIPPYNSLEYFIDRKLTLEHSGLDTFSINFNIIRIILGAFKVAVAGVSWFSIKCQTKIPISQNLTPTIWRLNSAGNGHIAELSR